MPQRGRYPHVKCQAMPALIGWNDDGWRVLWVTTPAHEFEVDVSKEVLGSPNSVPTLSGSYSAASTPPPLPPPPPPTQASKEQPSQQWPPGRADVVPAIQVFKIV